ncbi:MAG TPA: helix-turn-helix transcriptional regulator [Trichocoleus sp.]
MFTVKVRRTIVQEVEAPKLGERLEQAREKAGLKVAELCRQVGISRTYWYQLVSETAQIALGEEILRKLEQVLDVDLGVQFDD